MITSLTQAQRTDPTVHRMLAGSGSLESCVIALANEKEALVKRLMELEAIAPKKIKMPDGTVMIWHCPDELVPLQNAKVSQCDGRGPSVGRPAQT